MVTQRSAKPCTPVQFRAWPPLAKSICSLRERRRNLSRVTPYRVFDHGYEPASDDQAAARSLVRPAASRSPGLDDAAGGALPAGISRAARPRGQLSRSLLQPGDGGGSHVAADPALSFRRGHPVLGHSGRSPCTRAIGAVRGRRRPAPRPACDSGRHTWIACGARRRDVRSGLRHGAADQAEARSRRDVDRVLRRALDGRDLHGGGPGNTRPGAGEAHGLSRAGRVRAPDRHPRFGLRALSRRTTAGRRRGGAALRHLGGRSAAARVRALVHRTGQPDRRSGAPASTEREIHRLSARRRWLARNLRRPRPGRRREHRLGRGARVHSRAHSEPGRRAGQSRSVGAIGRGARRSTGRSTTCWRISATGG